MVLSPHNILFTHAISSPITYEVSSCNLSVHLSTYPPIHYLITYPDDVTAPSYMMPYHDAICHDVTAPHLVVVNIDYFDRST